MKSRSRYSPAIQHLCEAGQVHKVYSIIAESKKPEAGAQRSCQVVSEPAQGTVSSSFAAMDLGDEGTDAPAESTDPDGWEAVTSRRKKK